MSGANFSSNWATSLHSLCFETFPNKAASVGNRLLAWYAEWSQASSSVLMFFFRIAWLAKVRLPTIMTAVMMAMDIRVRLEIDIW